MGWVRVGWGGLGLVRVSWGRAGVASVSWSHVARLCYRVQFAQVVGVALGDEHAVERGTHLVRVRVRVSGER